MAVGQRERVAVVTGGGRGIGTAISARLAADGVSVAVLDLDGDSAVSVAKGLPHGAEGFGCDISSREQVHSVIASVAERYGRIDILVNNAGMTSNAPFLQMPASDWDAVLAVNLTGPFLVTQAVAPVMLQHGYGRIVFISSLAALGNPGQTNYTAAKAGVNGMAKTIALELGPAGITVNVVAPGYIETEMSQKFATESGRAWAEVKTMMAERSAVKRIGEPQDIAELVAYLALPAAGFITGQTIYATGGPVG